MAGSQAHPGRPAQPVRGRVDADHVPGLDRAAASQQLEHQVGADVAGPDDRRSYLVTHSSASGAKQAVTLPSPANVAVKTSPSATATDAVIEPGSTTCPARSTTPRAPTVLASQASEVSGEPRTAPPAPVPATSPRRRSTQPDSRRSISPSRRGVLPSTTPPEEALSAMVSSR